MYHASRTGVRGCLGRPGAAGFAVGVQFVGLINSVCHVRAPTADGTGTAGPCGERDVAWVAALTGGDGFHRGHHLAPNCARHSHLRGGAGGHPLDALYVAIRCLEALGVATDVVHDPDARPPSRRKGA